MFAFAFNAIYVDFIFLLKTAIATINDTIVYDRTTINGIKKSLYMSFIPFMVFWASCVAFLNGNTFMNVIIPSFNIQ